MDTVVSFLPVAHWKGELPVEAVSDGNKLLSGLCGYLRQPHGRLTVTGRAGITAILAHLGLKREDEVWILTTFDLPNVSSHVTSTIFNVCKPSRVLTDRTRAVFIIHEFGVPHPDTPALAELAKDRRIPLIEDCAHTIDSRGDGWRVGSSGDYVIISFPKIFPTNYGGALLGKELEYVPTALDLSRIEQAAGIASYFWASWPEQAACRKKIYRKLTDRFKDIGLSTLFEVTDNVTPWFFPVRVRHWQKMIETSKQYGVECALWHGSDIVVFPCHQFLEDEHIERIAAAAAKGLGG